MLVSHPHGVLVCITNHRPLTPHFGQRTADQIHVVPQDRLSGYSTPVVKSAPGREGNGRVTFIYRAAAALIQQRIGLAACAEFEFDVSLS